ncbi:MAG: S49 family peptidase [Myxococcales bacterium]|nr:S49 family peptidase [Myxococcales bacterium]
MSRARRGLAAPLGVAVMFALGGGSAGCEGRPRSVTEPSAAPAKTSGPYVATLDVSAGLPEAEDAGYLGLTPPKHRTFWDFLSVVDAIRKDKRVKGVFVRFGSANLGAARAEEMGDALFELRRGGTPIHCHAEALSNTTMMAAAQACTKITISPAGDVDTIGLAAQVIYLRRLLVDELRLSVDILQVGKFKGAEEPLTRDGPSDEARASLEGVLTDLRATWRDTTRAGRAGREGAKVEDAIEDGPFSPKAAVARGLVDAVGYDDDALKDLEKVAGAGRHKARFGPGGGSEEDETLGELVRALAGDGAASGPVALVRAVGSISMGGGGGPFGGRGGITERELSKQLATVEKDDDIKALVLRIDSPGGSALASDMLWHDLMRIRAKKPIVVSVGDMAASGGYYLASTGNVILGDPMSIVGSIGVVGGKVGVGAAVERFGVRAVTFPAAKEKPGAGARAAYLSFFSTWDDATKVRVLESMTAVYDLFLARVAEGRGTTPDKIAPHAEGRIFSGREGKRLGLVDELGGLRAAVVKARQLAKLPDDARVSVVGGRPTFLDSLEPGGAEESAAVRRAAGLDPLTLFGRVAPEATPFVTSLLPLAERERVLVATPFALWIR